MAWNAALAVSYGYGRVYREYPQAQLEQQPPRRLLPVFQPPPIGFPKLGQWWPHAMDAPDATVPIFTSIIAWRKLPVRGGPVIAFPELGQWQPGIMNPPDPKAIWLQFKLPRVIPPLPLPPIPSWLWQLDNQAAISRLDEVLYLVQIGYGPLPTGQPVAFPKLGSWPKGIMDAPIPYAAYQFKLPIVPFVPPTPTILPKPPSSWIWRQYYLDWPQIAVGVRLPIVTVPQPVPPTPPQPVSCYTLEIPPTALVLTSETGQTVIVSGETGRVIALAGENPQIVTLTTEQGLVVVLTGETPHICF